MECAFTFDENFVIRLAQRDIGYPKKREIFRA